MFPGLFGGAPNPFAAFLNRPQAPPLQMPPMQMPTAPRPQVPQLPMARPQQADIQAQLTNPLREAAFAQQNPMAAFYGQTPFERFKDNRLPGVRVGEQLPAGFRNTWENPFFALQRNVPSAGGGGGGAPQSIDPKIPVGSIGGTLTPSKGSEIYRDPNRNDPRFIWNGQRYVKPSWERGG